MKNASLFPWEAVANRRSLALSSPLLRLSLAVCFGVCLGQMPSSAQVLDTRRLIPKNAAPGELAGAVAVGGGKIALGSRNAVNPQTGQVTGAVYLFDPKTGKELKTVFPPAADANTGMEFGFAVAISGTVMVIGAPGTDTSPAASDNRGAGYLFDLKTSKFIGGKIQHAFFSASERMGQSVAIDGDFIALGTPDGTGFSENAGIPTGLVYARNTSTGEETFVSPDSLNLPGATTGEAGDAFGTAIALRGNLLAVSAPGADISGDTDAGRVYVAGLNPGGEAALLSEIDNPHVADGGQDGTDDRFGESLALGSRCLVVGVPNDEGSQGTAHVFDARQPVEVEYFTFIAGLSPGDRLGQAVATAGNQVFVSSNDRLVFGYILGGPYAGTQVFSTVETDPGLYGRQIAVADDVLAVAAPGWDTFLASDSGSVVTHPTTGLACPDVFPLALSGNAAHDAGADTYVSFSEVAANLNTSVTEAASSLYFAKTKGAMAAAGSPLGLWAYDSVLAAAGLIASSSASTPKLSRPIGNGAGGWWWRAQHKGSNRVNFFSSTSSQGQLHNGDGQLWGVARPIKAVDELRVDTMTPDAALVTLRLKTGGDVNAGNDSGIYDMTEADEHSQGFVLREGDPLGPPNLNFGEIAPRVAFSQGTISYTAGLSGSATTPQTNQAVFGAGTPMAVRGDTAPGAKNTAGGAITATFSSFLGATHNDAGNGLFRATLNSGGGVTSANNEGLWSNRTGSLGLVLQKGVAAPLLGGDVKVKRILDYAILTADDILVLAQVSGPGVKSSNDLVLYLSREDAVEPGFFEILAREGDRLPALNGARLGGILALEVATTLEDGGHNRYGLLCSLVNEAGRVTAATNQVWLVGDTAQGALDQLAARRTLPKLRKGAASHFFGIGFDKITSIAFPAVTKDGSGARNTGMAHVIDPRSGGSTGVLSFPNKRKAVGMIFR